MMSRRSALAVFLSIHGTVFLVDPRLASAGKPCPAGRVISEDTAGQCCWPGQSWSRQKLSCLGRPDCPAGFLREDESCREVDAPSLAELQMVDDRADCEGIIAKGLPAAQDDENAHYDFDCGQALAKLCGNSKDASVSQTEVLRKVITWIVTKAPVGNTNPPVWRGAYECLYDLTATPLSGPGDFVFLTDAAVARAKEWAAKGQYAEIALQILFTRTNAAGSRLRVLEAGKGFVSLVRNNLNDVRGTIKDYGSPEFREPDARSSLAEAIEGKLDWIDKQISRLAGTPSAKEAAGLRKESSNARREFERKKSRFSIQDAKAANVSDSDAGESVEQLCMVSTQLQQVMEAERQARRIDAASGTVNLYEKRQRAAARIYLESQRSKLAREVAKAGHSFDRKRDCASADE